jgi:hypothetical protein
MRKDKSMRKFAALLIMACGSLAMSGWTAAAQSVEEKNTEAAEKVCLPAVAERAGTEDVSVIRTHFDEMVTSVTVGAGPDRKPYRCVVIKDGDEEYIQSIIEE